MEIVFFVVLVILLSIAAGFGTNAAVRITGINPSYKNNKDLVEAHSKLTLMSVIAWIGVAVIVTCVILIFAFDLETVSSIFIYGLMFISLVLLGVVGVYSAWAASLIADADVKDDNKSRRQAIIAASLALGGIGLIIIGFIVKIFVIAKKDKKSSIDTSSLLGSGLVSELGEAETLGEDAAV